MDAACSIPLVCSRNFIRLSRFPFQNVRLDQRVKRARLEQSGVKSTAEFVLCIKWQAVNKQGNEHRLSQFGHFMHIPVYDMYASV